MNDPPEEPNAALEQLTCAPLVDAMGRVLVLSSGGYPDASHGGGIELSHLQRRGLAGVLADGRLRNFDQLGGYGFATWCRGEATRWGGDTVMPYAVVIPAASLTRVLDEAHAIEHDDNALLAAILQRKASDPSNMRATPRDRP